MYRYCILSALLFFLGCSAPVIQYEVIYGPLSIGSTILSSDTVALKSGSELLLSNSDELYVLRGELDEDILSNLLRTNATSFAQDYLSFLLDVKEGRETIVHGGVFRGTDQIWKFHSNEALIEDKVLTQEILTKITCDEFYFYIDGHRQESDKLDLLKLRDKSKDSDIDCECVYRGIKSRLVLNFPSVDSQKSLQKLEKELFASQVPQLFLLDFYLRSNQFSKISELELDGIKHPSLIKSKNLFVNEK